MILNPMEFYGPERAYDMTTAYQRLTYNLDKGQRAIIEDDRMEAQREVKAAQNQLSVGYCAYLTEARRQNKTPMDLDAVLTILKN